MRKLFSLFVLSIVLSITVHAESLKNKIFGNAIVKEVISIYDADTFRANIKDWPDIIGYRMSIRLNGVDTCISS
jgi:micrococcal nuclease